MDNLVNTIHVQFKFLTLSMSSHTCSTKTLTLETSSVWFIYCFKNTWACVQFVEINKKYKPMLVSQLLSKVQDSDELLESNLSTILKTSAWIKTVLVQETKWAEVLDMRLQLSNIFLTFTLCWMNAFILNSTLKKGLYSVPEWYPIGKRRSNLSVQKVFSKFALLKNHAFWLMMLCSVRQVTILKKECQSMGAACTPSCAVHTFWGRCIAT